MNLKYGKICNAIAVWCTVGSSMCDMYIVPEQHPACRLENHSSQRLTCGKINVLMISDFRRDLNIENVLLGISPASICSWPTFWNPVSVPSSKAGGRLWGVRGSKV